MLVVLFSELSVGKRGNVRKRWEVCQKVRESQKEFDYQEIEGKRWVRERDGTVRETHTWNHNPHIWLIEIGTGSVIRRWVEVILLQSRNQRMSVTTLDSATDHATCHAQRNASKSGGRVQRKRRQLAVWKVGLVSCVIGCLFFGNNRLEGERGTIVRKQMEGQ